MYKCVLLGVSLALSSFAHVIGQAPLVLQVDGGTNEWPDPPTQQDALWFAHSPSGLVGAGRLLTTLTETSRIEVRVSLVTQGVEMPPIGFFPGMTEPCIPPSEYNPVSDYKKCRAWVEVQKRYRANLRSLFERRWVITPRASGGLKIEETVAAAGWKALTAIKQTAASRLKPLGVLPIVATVGKKPQSFEILIPWDALPPTPTLHLERVRLSIRVYDDSAVRVSSDRTFWGETSDELAVYSLFPAVSFRSSACESPLAGPAGQTAYALIRSDRQIRSAFTFETMVACCGAISTPQEGWLSPVVDGVDFVEYSLQNPPTAAGDWICGPVLAWRRAGDRSIVSGSGITLGVPEGFYGQSLASAKPPQIRQLSNGTWLVRDVPAEFSRIQSYTQCSGCPWRKIAIYSFSPKSGRIQVAFSILGRMDMGIEDLDAEMSPDWSVITSYQRTHDTGWTATRHCLMAAEGVYKPCAVGGEPKPIPSAPKPGFFQHP